MLYWPVMCFNEFHHIVYTMIYIVLCVSVLLYSAVQCSTNICGALRCGAVRCGAVWYVVVLIVAQVRNTALRSSVHFSFVLFTVASSWCVTINK